MKVIFLSGIHGVGKSYLGSLVANKLSMLHFTASQLIREEKGHENWGSNKRVLDIDENQNCLIRSLRRRREEGQHILLDGHFVLKDKDGNLNRISEDVFEKFDLSGVILLTEDEHVISTRLALRDGVQNEIQTLRDFAAEEELHAKTICNALRLPLTTIRSANVETMERAIVALTTESQSS